MLYKNKSKLIKHIEKSIKNQKHNNKSEFIIDIGDSKKIYENIIDFRFDFNNIIENIKYLIGSDAKYSINCNKVKFNYEVYFTDIELKGEVDFSGAYFKKDVNFNSIIFKDKIYFSDAVINSEMNFLNSSFYKETNFVSSIINGIVNFEAPSFRGNITFAESIINKISINNMVMTTKNNLFFSYISFKNSYSSIEIISNIDDKSFINQLYLIDTNIKGIIDIKNIETNIVDFKGSIINGGLVNPVKFKVNNFANRESALFLKNEAYARNNIIDALEYKSKEIVKHKEELLYDKPDKSIRDWGDIFSIYLSSIYSDNGLNCVKSFILTILFTSIFFTLSYIPTIPCIFAYILFIFYVMINIFFKDITRYVFVSIFIYIFSCLFLPILYCQAFNVIFSLDFLKELLRFFAPTNFSDIINADIINNIYIMADNIAIGISKGTRSYIYKNSSAIEITIKSISYFLGKIAFWYGSVQTVQAFRKFNKGK